MFRNTAQIAIVSFVRRCASFQCWRHRWAMWREASTLPVWNLERYRAFAATGKPCVKHRSRTKVSKPAKATTKRPVPCKHRDCGHSPSFRWPWRAWRPFVTMQMTPDEGTPPGFARAFAPRTLLAFSQVLPLMREILDTVQHSREMRSGCAGCGRFLIGRNGHQNEVAAR